MFSNTTSATIDQNDVLFVSLSGQRKVVYWFDSKVQNQNIDVLLFFFFFLTSFTRFCFLVFNDTINVNTVKSVHCACTTKKLYLSKMSLQLSKSDNASL